MTTISKTDLENARTDALALASFVNDDAGTVATRTGGTIPNLKSLIQTAEDQLLGDETFKTTAGNVTVTTERKVLIKKSAAQATTVTLPLASGRARIPITVSNLGTNDYAANPTTVALTSPDTFDNGDTSFVMDATGQTVTFWPMPDNSGYYKG